VAACLAEVERARAAERISNPSGLMIKLLRADKHRQLGWPGGGRCGICESTDDVRNYGHLVGEASLLRCRSCASTRWQAGEPSLVERDMLGKAES
jgi:hypothetical protein